MQTIEKISPNIGRTAEGYIICYSVPLSRTGTQQYSSWEVPIDPDANGKVLITRSESEVFSPLSIASFEGKPVTINHPSEFVTSKNWKSHAVGYVKNVHREGSLLVGDLVVTDEYAVNAILKYGLREISVGYDAAYKQTDLGKGYQTNIVANHIALVKNARCGKTCSVRDENSMETYMGNAKPTLFQRLLKAIRTNDEDELQATIDCMDSKDSTLVEVTAATATVQTTAPTNDAGMEDILKRIQVLESVFDRLTAMANTTDSGSGIESAVTKVESDDESESCSENESESCSENESDPETKGDDDGEDKDDKDDSEKEPNGVNENEKTKDEASESAIATVDDVKVKSTNDSSEHIDLQDIVSRADVLAPGFKMPIVMKTNDSGEATNVLDACACKKSVLQFTLSNKNAGVLNPFLAGRTLDSLDCASVSAIFVAASELLSQRNNEKLTKSLTLDAKRSNTDLNQINKDFWSQRG